MERLTKDLLGIREDLLTKDTDYVMGIEGHEGVGKTSLGLQACKIVDTKFDENAIILNLEQLKDAIRNSYKGKAIQIDEGVLLLYRRNAMIKDQREILQIFQVCRKYNLFIIICIPSITALDKYMVDYRMKGLLKVTKRGRFFAFSKPLLNKIKKSRFSDKLYYPRPLYKESFKSAKKVCPKLWSAYLEKTKKVLDRERFNSKEIKPTIFQYRTMDLAKILGINRSEVNRMALIMKEDKHFIRTQGNHRRFAPKALELWPERLKTLGIPPFEDN